MTRLDDAQEAGTTLGIPALKPANGLAKAAMFVTVLTVIACGVDSKKTINNDASVLGDGGSTLSFIDQGGDWTDAAPLDDATDISEAGLDAVTPKPSCFISTGTSVGPTPHTTSYPGDSFTVTWSGGPEGSVDSCSITYESPGSAPESDWATGATGELTTAPIIVGEYTYTLSCVGPGGSCTSSAYHEVLPAP